MKAFNQIRNAIELIKLYKSPEPLNNFLKNEFKKRPQFGSNDRRLMRELCICYFKVGKSLPETDYEKRILIGFFLNNVDTHPVFECLAETHVATELIPLISADWSAKKTAASKYISFDNIYPFYNQIEQEIIDTDFYKNFFNKPVTWLRVRIKAKDRFEDFLNEFKIPFQVHPTCSIAYAFTEQINIASWPTNIQQAIEVQDIASQLSLIDVSFNDNDKVWDCCAASGGKSLLMHSLNTKIELYVSDVRQKIMLNLEERFKKVGIGNSFKALVDLNTPVSEILFENNKERKKAKVNYFDTILVDAPCSGSGTWRRNPERLLTVTEGEISTYIQLQKNITHHASHFLKPGGKLIYLTCSLYQNEDSNIISAIEKQGILKATASHIFNGMEWGGDIIYQTVFEKI